MAKKVIAIPDTHFPWVDGEWLAWVYGIVGVEKPEIIIQMGDLYDMYAASRFARTHDLMTPKQEIIEGREGAEAMWKNLRKASPKSTCYQIKGNHDIRPERKIQEVAPEIESLLNMYPLFEFDGVKTFHDPKEPIEIDGVLYMHGHLTQLGAHCKYFLQSVVHGHSHKGGVFVTRQHQRVLWELDCGFGSDEDAVPMRYGPSRRTQCTKGLGIIDNYGPRFVPYTPKKK